ncbi:MAG TPA: hypothetical protein VM778_08965 [Gemmatimonadota bacterium]|nr:hypothetical protein [Gemmatimonadota bacterium]
MTIRNRAALLALAAGLLASGPARAQEAPPALAPGEALLEIRLSDGSTLFGRVVEADEERVVVVTEAGARVEVDRSRVVSARPAAGVVRDGSLWPDDDADYRLFAAPTGRTLTGGTGTAGVIELFFPNVAYGITDRVQLGAGTAVFPEIVAEIFWVEPKVGLVSRTGLDVAIGAIAFFATSEIDEGSIGVVHLTGTFGGDRGALTVGGGWPFLLGGDESEFADGAVVSLGGEIRTGRRVKLISENHFLVGGASSDYGLISGGIRIFGDRLSADVGFGGVLGEEQACCLPIVNFSWAFGGR